MAKGTSLSLWADVWKVDEKHVYIHVNGSASRRPEIHCGRLVFTRSDWLSGVPSSTLGLEVRDANNELTKLIEHKALDAAPEQEPGNEVILDEGNGNVQV